MFILIFFLLLSLSQFINNKVLSISDESEDAYAFNKKDSIILGVIFLTGIILQVLGQFKLIDKIYWWACLGYFLISFIVLIVILQVRKTEIIKKREEMTRVYEILQKLVDKKGEGLDYNNAPFTLGYKYGNINLIRVTIDPITFDEKILIPLLSQLNNFLPTYTWNFDLHLDQRYIDFNGLDKPPTMARWPGSWLRPAKFMPLGLTGKGEIPFTPDSVNKKQLGRSLFMDNSGNPIPADTSLPSQPQGLVCGAPLGLNTIIPTTTGYKTIETIEIGDYVFDLENKPVKVLEKSQIYYNRKCYKLRFFNFNTCIEIISDSQHKFPKVKNNSYIETAVDNLKEFDKILGNNIEYILLNKVEILSEPVQCILVDSNSHLFLITDKKENNWNGGNTYPYNAIYTRNTGGGKAIWIEQEIN